MRKRVTFYFIFCCLACLIFGLPFSQALAQSTNASIKGTITDGSGEALPGATVMVRNESTGFSTGTITSAEGKYTFNQLPLGGPYTVEARFVGFSDQKRSGLTLSQGDQIKISFELSEAATELEQVVVTNKGLSSRIDRMGESTAITSQDLKKIPAQNRNFTDLGSLSPLAGGGINLGGQRRTSTNITLDGVNARNQLTAGELGRGPYTVSMEAIREFEVATNVYDVTQGRQAGGAFNVVTKSGTNTWSGSVFTYHRADWLASKYDIRGNERSQDFNTTQWGFSLGGPIIKDKMHIFVALDRQDDNSPFFISDIQDEADEQALGITKENLDRVVAIGRDLYGVSKELPQTGAFERKTVANTFFSRVDWQLSPKHRLTLRNNFSNWTNPESVSDNNNIVFLETYSNYSSKENSTMLSLRSAFSPDFLNEFKVQYQHAERKFEPNQGMPFTNIPRAITEVTSTLPDGKDRKVTVQFGGQRFTPETNLEKQVQLINTSYLTKGRVNFTFGTDNMLTYLDTYLSNEQNGRFFFRSLEDLENKNPYRYQREVPLSGTPDVQQWVLDASVFGQAQYNPHPDVSTTLGLRWDVTGFLTAADYNPVVEREFGIRTDEAPLDLNNIQPRFQLSWDINGARKNILKIGGGAFAAQPHYYAQVNNIQNSGTKLAEVYLDVNNGDAIPEPNFQAYREDPNSIPGLAYVPENPVSTINLISKAFQVPYTWKANINYNYLPVNWLRFGVNLLYGYTVNNYHYFDRNLVQDPYFRLANEDNRGVFVPASTISESGFTSNINARISDKTGRVMEMVSEGKLQQMTAVIDAEVQLPNDGSIYASYTINKTEDNTSYNCCVANSATLFLPVASDPRDLGAMSPSDNDFGSKVVVYGTSPTYKGFNFGARFSGTGGSRYSFVVNRDLNGDFVNINDLAYVYDPANANTPAIIKSGLESVLADQEVEESAKEYIRENYGQIIQRNGGRNPFYGTIDLRLAKMIRTYRGQSLELSVDVFNFANLMNKDWGGQYRLGRQNLLNVKSFDQETQQYTYEVNPSVGKTQKSGTPFQIQLGVRYAF